MRSRPLAVERIRARENRRLRRLQLLPQEDHIGESRLFLRAPIPYLLLGHNDRIQAANKAAESLFGVRPGALADLNFTTLLSEDDFIPYYRMRMGLVERGDRQRCELSLRLHDGNLASCRIFGEVLVDRYAPQTRHRIWLVILDATVETRALKGLNDAENRLEGRVEQRSAELQLRNDQLRSAVLRFSQIELRERRRMARAIHDDLQQGMAAAMIEIQRLRKREPVGELGASLERVQRMIQDSILVSRSISHELSPPALESMPFSATIEWMAQYIEQRHQTTVEVRNKLDSADEARIPREFSGLLYDGVRELVKNALTHGEASRIQIGLKLDDADRFVLEVNDNGRGFDAGGLERRLRQEALEQFGLFGLRELLHMLHGSLAIQSEPGSGAHIRMTIPLRHHPESAAHGPAGMTSAETIVPVRVISSGSQIRILVADDHRILRQGLVELLNEHPQLHVVGEAADGEQAVELARMLRPDLLLMDIEMPKCNGIEAARRIHQLCPEIKIIGLSMHDGRNAAEAMLAAGASHFVSKGSPVENLIQRIAEVVD